MPDLDSTPEFGPIEQLWQDVIAALVGQHVIDDRLEPYLALAREQGVSEHGLEAAMILLAGYVGQPAASRGAAAVRRTAVSPPRDHGSEREPDPRSRTPRSWPG